MPQSTNDSSAAITYVDDCLYWGSDDAAEAWFEQALGQQLKIDFMGDLSFYLGAHYDWQVILDGRLCIHCLQEGHIHKMLDQHSMLDANAVDSPYRSGLPIDRVRHDGLDPSEKPLLVKAYQSIVGSLNWISLSTRPDITPVTSLLATYLHNPSPGHLTSAKHVLRYLKGSSGWGITYTQI
ncbi:expressed unknown protein [Seminavis robusta]|uniref:Reverse transcriptase Ty1/copia-type domain-containing protein n=1 Tax=Seminavis robusta TaxID=568900 RepID=A0A9N8H2L7_9STRA|nr:expressed unknown protein [Seminavis robusta]|eukprot:Sro11_g008601.1  (181) ;mRNA; f:96241-96783